MTNKRVTTIVYRRKEFSSFVLLLNARQVWSFHSFMKRFIRSFVVLSTTVKRTVKEQAKKKSYKLLVKRRKASQVSQKCWTQCMIIREKSIEKCFADSTLVKVVVDNSIGPDLDFESESGGKIFFVYCDVSFVYTSSSKIRLSVVMWLEGKKNTPVTCNFFFYRRRWQTWKEAVFVSLQETKRRRTFSSTSRKKCLKHSRKFTDSHWETKEIILFH